jgi:hypothetical protein
MFREKIGVTDPLLVNRDSHRMVLSLEGVV